MMGPLSFTCLHYISDNLSGGPSWRDRGARRRRPPPEGGFEEPARPGLPNTTHGVFRIYSGIPEFNWSDGYSLYYERRASIVQRSVSRLVNIPIQDSHCSEDWDVWLSCGYRFQHSDVGIPQVHPNNIRGQRREETTRAETTDCKE